MKRVLAVFKDLQDSGHQVSIIGQYALQIGQFQDVAEPDNVYDPADFPASQTDEEQNLNRYTTEHGLNDFNGYYAVSQPTVLLPDLLEMVGKWADLPKTLRDGILVMIRTITNR